MRERERISKSILSKNRKEKGEERREKEKGRVSTYIWPPPKKRLDNLPAKTSKLQKLQKPIIINKIVNDK
jgi:hypothetical protein